MENNNSLIHAHATQDAVAVFAKAVFGIWAVFIFLDPFTTLSQIPYSLYDPVSVYLRYLPGSTQKFFLSFSFLLGLKVILVFVLLLTFSKRLFISAGIISCLLLSLHQALVNSFGHIRHAEANLLYAAYLLVLFAMADQWVLNKSKVKVEFNIYSIPLIVILSVLLVCYSLMGAYRLINGGVEVFTNDYMTHWIVTNAHRGRFISFGLDQLVLEHGWLRQMFNYGYFIGTIIEILSPLCLISKKFRYLFLMVMIPFHILIYVFMGILFWENLLLFVLLFDITSWIAKGKAASTLS